MRRRRKGRSASTPSTRARSSPARCAITGSTCPKQYDPAKPACLYVNQDGVQYKRPDGLRRADPQEGNAGRDRRVRHARPGQGPLRARRSIGSIAASNTTAWATTTFGSCWKSCLPEVEKKTTADGRPIRLSHDGNDRCIGGCQQRRDLRVHGGVGAARRLPPRLQRDRHLRRPARRQRLSDPDPQVRAEADPHLPPGRQLRPEHLRRRLVDGQPGDGACPRSSPVTR